ncbi:MAG: hypothetical protein ACTTIV_00260 [Campylobacter sp.]
MSLLVRIKSAVFMGENLQLSCAFICKFIKHMVADGEGKLCAVDKNIIQEMKELVYFIAKIWRYVVLIFFVILSILSL